MPIKFEKLGVWQLALEYVDLMYELAEKLPKSENFNLKSQLTRAATSITLPQKIGEQPEQYHIENENPIS